MGINVDRGVISPVHDGYRKPDLAPFEHRFEMARLAAESSDWIEVTPWEGQQANFTATLHVVGDKPVAQL